MHTNWPSKRSLADHGVRERSRKRRGRHAVLKTRDEKRMELVAAQATDYTLRGMFRALAWVALADADTAREEKRAKAIGLAAPFATAEGMLAHVAKWTVAIMRDPRVACVARKPPVAMKTRASF